MMKVSFDINKVLDSKATGLLVFSVTGVAKLASDYKNAPDNKKDFVLLRDSLILGGSAAGVGLYGLAGAKLAKSGKSVLGILTKPITKRIKNTNFYKNNLPTVHKLTSPLSKINKHAKEIVKRCADNTAMLACGILGAVGADYGIRYSHLEKKRRLRKVSDIEEKQIGTLYNYESRLKNRFQNSSLNKNLEHTVGSEITTNIYSRITDLPAMRMFSRTMVGMQGFEVIEEKTFKKRMKHATGCLISNSVIPLFFLSTATSLTKKMNGIVRAPIIFASLVGGTMYANKALNHYEKVFEEKERIKAEQKRMKQQAQQNTQEIAQNPAQDQINTDSINDEKIEQT